MKVLLIALLAAFTLFAGQSLADGNAVRKPFHKDVTCVQCHGVENPVNPPNTEACLECHGSMDDLVKSTAKFERNPHRSPHWGTEVPCYTCHREHQPSELMCSTRFCHVKNFENVVVK